MCGIVGAVAERDVLPILVEGLRRLEYRGYDSAGVAVIDGAGGLGRVRVSGKDPEVLARYEAEGFEHVLLWANQFWPEEGDVDVKRAALFGAAAELGVRPR